MKSNFALGTGLTPSDLRRQLRESSSGNVRRRRAIIGFSLFGMANMAIVSLLQTGIVKHLPDPPLCGFDSDKINCSNTAYQLGTPDGTLSLAGLAANLPIAGFGGERRGEKMPLVPILASVKSGIEAAAAGWYFYQMAAKEKKWCPYCIGGALANFTIFSLTVPEAIEAAGFLRSR